MAESARNDRAVGGGRPSSARWRSTLLLGLPAIVMVFAALLISVYERTALLATEGVVTLDSARAEIDVDGRHVAETVRLPYAWDRHHPGRRGHATFTLTFTRPETTFERWALQIPKVGNAFEVRLNGSRLETQGDVARHDGEDSTLFPRHVSLGRLLRAGANEITILIRADRERGAGLSQVLMGPADEIRADRRQRYNWMLTSLSAAAALSLGVGLLSIGLWRSVVASPDEGGHDDASLYRYAALAELTGGAAAAAGLLSSPPIAWPWWGVILVTAACAAAGWTVLSCVEIAGWGASPHARRLRRWLVALVLACPAVAYAALGLGHAWALTAWYGLLGLAAIAFSAVFVGHTARTATVEQQLASIAIAVNVAAAIHDFYAFNFASDYLHITMLEYSSSLFDLTLGAIVILRFRAAHRRVFDLTRTLADRVKKREQELEASYLKLEALARQQARMQERASILRDMHDGVGAHLSMAIRQLESGRGDRRELMPPLRDALDQLKLTIDNVNLPPGDVASLMGNLRYRLGPRIEAAGIALHWNVEPISPIERLDAQDMRELMFILFEAISNALQHSRASELRIEAREAGGRIGLRVVDDGIGFDVAWAAERGLLSYRNSAERIGARFGIRSRPGETAVEIDIPRETTAAAGLARPRAA